VWVLLALEKRPQVDHRQVQLIAQPHHHLPHP
jgi:hypothetical protein